LKQVKSAQEDSGTKTQSASSNSNKIDSARSRKNSSRCAVVEINLPVACYSTRKAQMTTEYEKVSPERPHLSISGSP
jgi:hypothetical protein